MSDELKLTDEQLRLATSRSLPPGASLDAQTSAARDSFLSFGAALESAAGDLDEAALLSRITPSREQTCSRSRPVPDWWPLLLCGALAASGLFAILRIAVLPTADSRIANSNQSNHLGVAEQRSQDTWQQSIPFYDPIDDEIAVAAAVIQQYGSRGQTVDGSLFDMNVQLEALSQELRRESL